MARNAQWSCPDELYERIRSYAERVDRSISWITREALVKYMAGADSAEKMAEAMVAEDPILRTGQLIWDLPGAQRQALLELLDVLGGKR